MQNQNHRSIFWRDVCAWTSAARASQSQLARTAYLTLTLTRIAGTGSMPSPRPMNCCQAAWARMCPRNLTRTGVCAWRSQRIDSPRDPEAGNSPNCGRVPADRPARSHTRAGRGRADLADTRRAKRGQFRFCHAIGLRRVFGFRQDVADLSAAVQPRAEIHGRFRASASSSRCRSPSASMISSCRTSRTETFRQVWTP